MASISVSAVASSASWHSPATGKFTRVCIPSASLSLLSGSRRCSSSLSAYAPAHSSSPLLQSSFLSSSLSLGSSFSGLSIEFNVNPCTRGLNVQKRRGLVVRAGKYKLCQTKRNRSRKSLARTHGFRRRMRTTSGRAILKRRRAKGRWDLCPKSNPNSGKRA